MCQMSVMLEKDDQADELIMENASLLEVKDLAIKCAVCTGEGTAANGFSFSLEKGEQLGLVGESGAGKSVTGFSIINLISKLGYIASGEVNFLGEDLASAFLRKQCCAVD